MSLKIWKGIFTLQMVIWEYYLCAANWSIIFQALDVFIGRISQDIKIYFWAFLRRRIVGKFWSKECTVLRLGERVPVSRAQLPCLWQILISSSGYAEGYRMSIIPPHKEIKKYC